MEARPWQEELCDLALRSLVVAFVMGGAHLLIRRNAPRTVEELPTHNLWPNQAVSIVHASFMGVMAMRALFYEMPFAGTALEVSNFSKVVDTVHGDSQTLWTYLPWTLGYFTYDAFLMVVDDKIYSHLMMGHHVLSLLLWPASVVSRAGSFYVLCFLAAEISTPLLNVVVFFLPSHGITGLGRTLLGAVLIVVFFLVRVLPSPFLLYGLWSSFNRDQWRDVNPVVTVAAAVSIPIPSFLFAYWFTMIILGTIKAILPGKTEDKGPKNE